MPDASTLNLNRASIAFHNATTSFSPHVFSLLLPSYFSMLVAEPVADHSNTVSSLRATACLGDYSPAQVISVPPVPVSGPASQTTSAELQWRAKHGANFTAPNPVSFVFAPLF